MFDSIPWGHDMKPQIVLLTSTSTHHVYMQTPFSIRQWNHIFRKETLNPSDRHRKEVQLLKDAEQEREALEDIRKAQRDADRPECIAYVEKGTLLKDTVMSKQALIDNLEKLRSKYRRNFDITSGSRRTWAVSIRTMLGQHCGFLMQPTGTLDVIKRQTEELLGIPTRYQRLIWWGRDITDFKGPVRELWRDDYQEILLLPKTADWLPKRTEGDSNCETGISDALGNMHLDLPSVQATVET